MDELSLTWLPSLFNTKAVLYELLALKPRLFQITNLFSVRYVPLVSITPLMLYSDWPESADWATMGMTSRVSSPKDLVLKSQNVIISWYLVPNSHSLLLFWYWSARRFFRHPARVISHPLSRDALLRRNLSAHFCYLRWKDGYIHGVHRGCYLGDERHPLTHVGQGDSSMVP
jgi:hypothetical protein